MLLPIDETIIRLAWALLLGTLVGLEREWTQKSAGLRTHILVCMGACGFTILSVSSMTQGIDFSAMPEDVQINIVRDPGRIAAQVVTGIGFVGGGALLRHGASVRGLTTAASLWMVASLGMLAGTGYYQASLVATLLTILVLLPIGRLERFLFKKHLKHWNRLRLKVSVENDALPDFQNWIEQHHGKNIIRLKSFPAEESDLTVLTYILDVSRVTLNMDDLSRSIGSTAGVKTTSLRLFEDSGTED